MIVTGKRYTMRIKMSILERAEEGDMRPAQAHGVSDEELIEWRKKLKKYGKLSAKLLTRPRKPKTYARHNEGAHD